MRAAWMAIAVCGAVVAAAAAKPVGERVTIKNGTGQEVGTATFTQVKSGIKVKIDLKNMPIGAHGVHIHQNPTCEGPDFKTAGGHFNPDHKQHGFENPAGHHAGDMPQNVTVQENHMGEASFVITSLSLDPKAPNSLYGTSIVVHEKADDMKTDPSGNSGNRIACGVIPAAH